MGTASDPALLSLHGVRVLGGPSTAAIAERFGLPAAEVAEHLLDAQAYGWVTRYDYFGETWSLTERGKAENERQLAAELDELAARPVVAEAHRRFLALNGPHGVACTNWQLRPLPGAPRAVNDHSDPVWDMRVLVELEALDEVLHEVVVALTEVLTRFAGYDNLHRSALARVRRGAHEWLDAPDRQSCQLVWIQLHEDLLASLQIPRGSDG
ncbi:MAG: transcriptional regulator [Micropruina sp.]|nr:transcriptional regulator [Micropruina sp.]